MAKIGLTIYDKIMNEYETKPWQDQISLYMKLFSKNKDKNQKNQIK